MEVPLGDPTWMRKVTLTWLVSDVDPFCRSTIVLDLDRVTPTRRQIAAVFGLAADADFEILDAHGALCQGDHWHDGRYGIRLTDEGRARLSLCRIPAIKDIYASLPSGDMVGKLCAAFYRQVFDGTGFNESFQTLFVGEERSAASAAHNLSMWLTEMWGGPPYVL